jgi:hypothetical protein
MSFELRSGDSLRKGIRRVIRKQLDDALEELTGEHRGQRDEAVHETRKCFKKVRAVLRLVRPVIGTKAYRAENTCLRDAARPLTEVRDAKILIETLDGLIEHFREHIAGRAFGDRHFGKRILRPSRPSVSTARSCSAAPRSTTPAGPTTASTPVPSGHSPRCWSTSPTGRPAGSCGCPNDRGASVST